MTLESVSQPWEGPTHNAVPLGLGCPSQDEVETVCVLIHRADNSYNLSFLTPNFGHVPLRLPTTEPLRLAIAKNSQARFVVLLTPGSETIEPVSRDQENYFDGEPHSAGEVGAFRIVGGDPSTVTREFTFQLESEPQRDFEIFVLPKNDREVYAFFWAERPTLGIYHNSHSVFIPEGSKLKFKLHSKTAKDYEISKIEWGTGSQQPPSWLAIFPRENEDIHDRFRLETRPMLDRRTRWVGFDMFFIEISSSNEKPLGAKEGKLLKADFKADPTIVHRGSTNLDRPTGDP